MKGLLLPIVGMMFASATYSPTQIYDDVAPTSSVISSEPESEVSYDCKVVIGEYKHGEVTADKMEGNVGDTVTLTPKADLFYTESTIAVNGTNLTIGDDGKCSFVLVEGDNTVTATFEIDEDLLGELSSVIDSAENGDWTSVFSIESVLYIVKWVLDGGILIAIARYFIKDKKLSKSVEDKIQSTMTEIVPETTKKTVLENFEKVLTPMVSELQAENSQIVNAMGVFAKCMALSQENTPESRKAIIDELADLKISDASTLGDVKSYIEEMVAKQTKIYNDTLEAINSIEKKNTEIINGSESEETKETSSDNGTQI